MPVWSGVATAKAAWGAGREAAVPSRPGPRAITAVTTLSPVGVTTTGVLGSDTATATTACDGGGGRAVVPSRPGPRAISAAIELSPAGAVRTGILVCRYRHHRDVRLA